MAGLRLMAERSSALKPWSFTKSGVVLKKKLTIIAVTMNYNKYK